MTAEQVRVYLELEVKRLRLENTRLRRKVGERARHRQRIEQALNDAKLLLLWKGADVPTSLAFARQHANMGRRRWQNAVALLRMSRLLDFDWSWSLGTAADNDRVLGVAAGRAVASRASFLMRLTKHGQQTGAAWRVRQA